MMMALASTPHGPFREAGLSLRRGRGGRRVSRPGLGAGPYAGVRKDGRWPVAGKKKVLHGLPGNGAHAGLVIRCEGAWSLFVRLIAEWASSLGFASRRVTFLSRQKSNQKRLPQHPARLRRVPSLQRRAGGTARGAIPGPTRLSRHPCRSSPSATLPLGLLKGRHPGPTFAARFQTCMSFRFAPDSPAKSPLARLRGEEVRVRKHRFRCR